MFENIFSKGEKRTESSTMVLEGRIPNSEISSVIANPDFPGLVSFPRTGSHWFRILLEYYSNRPLLVRSFFDHSNNNYLLYHTHDMSLDFKRSKVIYLYRYPTDVVYSQIKYYGQNPSDKIIVLFWTQQYACHLGHWLFSNVSDNILPITYENLKNDKMNEFSKVTKFLKLDFDSQKLNNAYSTITKDFINEKTRHDERVINLSANYASSREEFYEAFDELIIKTIENISVTFFNDNRIGELFKNRNTNP